MDDTLKPLDPVVDRFDSHKFYSQFQNPLMRVEDSFFKCQKQAQPGFKTISKNFSAVTPES